MGHPPPKPPEPTHLERVAALEKWHHLYDASMRALGDPELACQYADSRLLPAPGSLANHVSALVWDAYFRRGGSR